MSFPYDFRRISTKQQLLTFLSIEEWMFDKVCAFDPAASRTSRSESQKILLEIPAFIRHEIAKKNPKRGKREIWEPLGPYSEVYKSLARRIGVFFRAALDPFPHPNCFGYVKGRNIRENASVHIGHRNLLHIDIKDFFPSITIDRVHKLLVSVGINEHIARLLSQFLTIEGRLPLGLHPSPTIANAICLELDKALTELASSHSATFSRYADDIAFSGNGDLPTMSSVEGRLAEFGFQVAEDKTRVSKAGQAHFVTGLSISDNNAPHVPKAKKRRLRQELYYAQKFGISDHIQKIASSKQIDVQREINRIDGTVKYVAFHEPKIASRLRSSLAVIQFRDKTRASFSPKNQDRLGFTLFFDESEFTWNGEKMLALGVAASQHWTEITSIATPVLQDFLASPWADGDREKIKKNGLHFADATEDLRGEVVAIMQKLPFLGYVAFARYNAPDQYESVYLNLLNALIRRRLMAAESRHASLIFEKNNKVSKDSICDVIDNAYADLKKENNRRPKTYFVGFADKGEFCLFMPDFLLGVLRRFLALEREPDKAPRPRPLLMFERLRDKYKLIVDIDKKVEYSRRNPILP